MRRNAHVAAVIGVALLLATSGCIGFVLGDEPLEFEASNATVSESGLDETGYTHEESQSLRENRTIERVDRDVAVEGHANVYAKTDEFLDREQQIAMFATTSIPEVEVLGRSFNPLSEMSNEELLDRFQSEMPEEYRGTDFTVDESKTVNGVLGESANVTRFTGTTEFEGQEVEVAVYITKVKHDGDWVVMMGAHPTQRPEEEYNIETLMQSVEHGDE
ncbi:hypothetical protein G9464_08860 [Halostella sp. JP-L12]|uniref:DUF6517 family protein n=1 Tax=Halostella TaxID=1843185 RepID=UPI000EF831F0|nr:MULTISPECIES: DUF6517 family protein [Halostella]NHN47706.1 hypothetical protein [Halostella sp. JP-L12]